MKTLHGNKTGFTKPKQRSCRKSVYNTSNKTNLWYDGGDRNVWTPWKMWVILRRGRAEKITKIWGEKKKKWNRPNISFFYYFVVFSLHSLSVRNIIPTTTNFFCSQQKSFPIFLFKFSFSHIYFFSFSHSFIETYTSSFEKKKKKVLHVTAGLKLNKSLIF